MSNPYQQYHKTSVTTAKKEKILLMLYEGAIKFVRQAQVKMQKNEISAKGQLISKSTAILSELMNTLDFKVGGQLAVDLENLYIFMIDQLIEGNIHNDIERLKNVEKLLKILYSAWSEVINNPQAHQKDPVGDVVPAVKEAVKQTKTTETTTEATTETAPMQKINFSA